MPSRINLDMLGITATFACAIHCAILPLLLTTLPLFGMEIIDNPFFEYTMIFLTLLIGIFSLLLGYRRHHHSLFPVTLFLGGIFLLFAKQYWHNYQLWFLPFALFFIVTAHLVNYRSCRMHNHAN